MQDVRLMNTGAGCGGAKSSDIFRIPDSKNLISGTVWENRVGQIGMDLSDPVFFVSE